MRTLKEIRKEVSQSNYQPNYQLELEFVQVVYGSEIQNGELEVTNNNVLIFSTKIETATISVRINLSVGSFKVEFTDAGITETVVDFLRSNIGSIREATKQFEEFLPHFSCVKIVEVKKLINLVNY
jgi:hypothetical protein